jgi:hypothetical protein
MKDGVPAPSTNNMVVWHDGTVATMCINQSLADDKAMQTHCTNY